MSNYIFITNDIDIDQPDYSKMVEWARNNKASKNLLELTTAQFYEINQNGFLDQVNEILDSILGTGEEAWEWKPEKKAKILAQVITSLKEEHYRKTYDGNTGVMNKVLSLIKRSVDEDLILFFIFEG